MSPRLLVRVVDDVAVIRFADKSVPDEARMGELKLAFDALADRAGHHKMVVDFNNLDFFLTLFIGVLLSLRKRLLTLKGDVKLVAGDGTFGRECLTILGMHKVFAIYPDEDEALGAFAADRR